MIPFLRNTFRRGIVAKVRTIYESARKITEFFPELCFLWTKVGVFGDETGVFFLNSGLPLPIGVPSKLSKGLCDPEKCRRNLRQGFATPKNVIETFDKALRPRKTSSKLSTGLCDPEKRRRKFRRDFATPKSAVETFDDIKKAITKKRPMPKHGPFSHIVIIFMD